MIQSFKSFSNTVNRPKPTKPAQLQLKSKTMRESFIQQFIFLKSDPFSKELYIGSDKQLRISKLLENLDALSAAIAYRHLDDGHILTNTDMLISVVTASVDRIDLITIPSFNMDLKIYGHVSYVGHSSMEVSLTIIHILYNQDYKLPDLQVFDNSSIPIYTAASPESSGIVSRVYLDSGNMHVNELNKNIIKTIPVMSAKFLMVARCALLHKAVQVHPLKLRNEKEQTIYNNGHQLRNLKRLQQQQSLLNFPPTPSELKTIHDLFINELNGNLLHHQSATINGMADLNKCYMKSTTLEITLVTQPQDRNVHNFIFGGYLLKTAFELAKTTAILFTNCKLVDFQNMDDVLFRLAVPIGSILRFRAMVVYSIPFHERQTIPKKWKESFLVQVVADVKDEDQFDTSNIFYFTFKPSEEVNVKFIVPETYQESMLYLQGKRTFEQGMQY